MIEYIYKAIVLNILVDSQNITGNSLSVTTYYKFTDMYILL